MRDNVLATLAYYDVLDFPLKAEEVLKCLIRLDPRSLSFYHARQNFWPSASGADHENGSKNLGGHDRGNLIVTIADIKKILDQLILEKLADFNQGYYFLPGRDYLAPLRLKREKISRKKWAKARQAIWWLKFIPYVEAVFASGSLALNNCDELSDLDVLVVTKHGRIWLTRFWITAWLSVIGARRKPFDKIAPDKICLNHYITDKSLRIPFESMYNAQNYVNLKPVLIRNWKIVEKFREENNWISKFVIGDWAISNDPEKLIRINRLARLVSGIGKTTLNTKLGDWLEKIARRYQIKRIEANPLTKSPTGHVVYSDEQLAFHPDSPESSVLERFDQKLAELKIVV